jgi:N-acetylglucosamine-6-phosphate deacetylase
VRYDPAVTASIWAVRGRLLGERPGAVVIRGTRIAAVLDRPRRSELPARVVDAPIVAPGFVDLQVNGAFGVEVGPGGAGALEALAARLPRTGVTAFLAALPSAPPETIWRLGRDLAAAAPAAGGARLLGAHLEGPFLSPARAGAHDPRIVAAARPRLPPRGVRLDTVAPERPGALPFIRRLVARGVVVSLGHTGASHEEMLRGAAAGARMVTHLFNAMAPFAHRAPGAVGAALIDDRLTCGLIADGVHCHAAAIRLAVRAKGPERVALVTDAMAAAGMPPGRYRLGGRPVSSDGVAARLADGTLAGSLLTMDRALTPNNIGLARSP